MRFYAPDGKLIGEASDMSLFLLPPGCSIDFSFNDRRKNYVTFCWLDDLRWNSGKATMEFYDHEQCIELPVTIPVPPVKSEYLTEIFRRTSELLDSAIPSDGKAAELLMLSVLAEFIEHSGKKNQHRIPEKLEKFKKAIDNDVNFEYKLEDIMEHFEYTPIHLRRLFMQYYQTNPAEYRSRLRFAKIRELLLKTDLNFKEIADSVGMNNVTHLHSFVKKHCGMTPKQLRQSLRI
jgi:AraC-like DNA-binding protein